MRPAPSTTSLEPASFRDPSGSVFWQEGVVYRAVAELYKENFQLLHSSGLYDRLIAENLLIPHIEVSRQSPVDYSVYTVIKPAQLDFISYPYEWCFSQIKDAALTTLRLQEIATEYGMSLKDANAYNIQFYQGKPLLIDSLSFEANIPGKPWIAYKQFCQHFLAPLALMATTDLRLASLLQIYIDGIPLDLASTLLPGNSRFNPGLYAHIHLHSQAQQRYAQPGSSHKPASTMKGWQQNGILESLRQTVQKLRPKTQKTEWGTYYTETNYSRAAFQHKQDIVSKWTAELQPEVIWDAGGNDGTLSALLPEAALILSTDYDPQAIELAYTHTCKGKPHILPLLIDLANPSPDLGWANTERRAFLKRCHADVTLALALIHHLAISNNLPLSLIASFFATHTKTLIIEFVPKEDSQVQKLLSSREDIFGNYDQKSFEKIFSQQFQITHQKPIKETQRTLYCLRSLHSS